MTTQTYCPVSGETHLEERINYYTHLLGFFLSLIGSGFLVWVSLSGDFWHIVSCSIYCISLIGLYGASTFYHRCDLVIRKKTWKIVDHVSIYLLIAGSYTPFTLGPLRHINGWELFYIVWGIALCGIAFKIKAIDRFKKLSVFSYLLLGWLIIFSFPALQETLSSTAINWLISGGLIYTFGTLFYAWDNLPFNHAIWHLFVLGGSTCHYCSILDILMK